MSVPDEQRQATAIRMALGTEDAEVTRAAAGGFNVRISDERAAIALDLYDRLGDAAGADTFVESAPRRGDTVSIADGKTTTIACANGSAADRERYVTERAEQLARAFDGSMFQRALKIAPMDARREFAAVIALTSIFRDLIDRGVLK